MSRICRLRLALAMMCLPAVVSGATVNGTLVVNLTTTIPVQVAYPVFILCNDVPAASCNPSAPLPLIHTENGGSAPPLPPGTQDTFKNINFSSLWSGYITFVALPQGLPSDVIIGLRNDFITAGSPWPFSTPESQIAADLLGGSQAQQTDLVNFFLNNLSAFPQMGSQGGQAGTFWEFSNAVNVGSFSATNIVATPEPSTILLMGLAFAFSILGAAVSRVRCSAHAHSKKLGV